MLHTIGFGHHQQRSDRDKFIAIHRENGNLTDEEYSTSFEQIIEFDERIKYLTPFDYESVMLCNEYMFSNGQPFITPTIEGAKIQPSTAVLSKYDQILINRFYNCESVAKMKSKIFYEDEFGLSYPLVVNYHEIARAKVHFNEVDAVVENDIGVDDHQNTDDVVTQSEPIQNNSSIIIIGQSDVNDRDIEDKENFL